MDPPEGDEQAGGSRPSRGIRGGKAAKRKREAYIRFQESQGVPRGEVPVVHTGGQQRPLFTPSTWPPESSEAEEETEGLVESLEVEFSDIVAPEELVAPSGELSLSRPTPEFVLLKARPKVKPSSSVTITRDNPLLSRPKSGSSASGSAAPKSPPKASGFSQSSRAVPKRKSEVPVIDVEEEAPAAPSSSSSSVRSFRPISQDRLQGVEAWSFDGDNLRERNLSSIGVVAQDARVVAVDWHQVTDTWRLNRRDASRANEETGDLPRQVVEFYPTVRSFLRPQDKLVILSHIERSERNKQFLPRLIWY